MPNHRIHLRGPWEIIPPTVAVHGLHPEGSRQPLPQDWQALFGDAAGTATFERNFHAPTNLEPHEEVWLLLTEVAGAGQISLNGQVIGEFQAAAGASSRFDITTFLKPNNRLRIDLTFDPASQPGPGGLYGPVALDIES